jgi:hypothetical protein
MSYKTEFESSHYPLELIYEDNPNSYLTFETIRRQKEKIKLLENNMNQYNIQTNNINLTNKNFINRTSLNSNDSIRNYVNQASLNTNDTYEQVFSDRLETKDTTKNLNSDFTVTETKKSKLNVTIPLQNHKNINNLREFKEDLEIKPQMLSSKLESDKFQPKIINLPSLKKIKNTSPIKVDESFKDCNQNQFEVSGKVYNQMFGDLNRKINNLTNENNCLKHMVLNNSININNSTDNNNTKSNIQNYSNNINKTSTFKNYNQNKVPISGTNLNKISNTFNILNDNQKQKIKESNKKIISLKKFDNQFLSAKTSKTQNLSSKASKTQNLSSKINHDITNRVKNHLDIKQKLSPSKFFINHY